MRISRLLKISLVDVMRKRESCPWRTVEREEDRYMVDDDDEDDDEDDNGRR